MNAGSLYGGVMIGKETSDWIKLSFQGQPAVRSSADGRFVSSDGVQLFDVTGLTLEGSQEYLFRFPVNTGDLRRGDLVVTSDNPFHALFVNAVRPDGRISGLDPQTSTFVDYVPPANPLFRNGQFLIAVQSLVGGFGQEAAQQGGGFQFPAGILPFLLLGKADGGDSFSKFLLFSQLAARPGQQGLGAVRGPRALPPAPQGPPAVVKRAPGGRKRARAARKRGRR